MLYTQLAIKHNTATIYVTVHFIFQLEQDLEDNTVATKADLMNKQTDNVSHVYSFCIHLHAFKVLQISSQILKI